MLKHKNSINFCGVSSESIPGLIINELPPIQMSPKRINQIQIEGRDGDIIEELGYMSYDKPVQMSLSGDYDIDKVFSWLNNSGDIIFSNEPDKVYRAAVYDTVAFERLVRFRKASLKFHVQPFKTLRNDVLRFNVTDEILNVKNHGNIYSRPIVEAQISSQPGILELNVNNDYIRIRYGKTEADMLYTVTYNLENGGVSLIDPEGAEVEIMAVQYSNPEGAPRLKPGDNKVGLTRYGGIGLGSQAKLTIKNASRWL